MTRTLSFIGALLLIAVGVPVLYLSLADLSRFRPEIEAAVSSAIGRDFKITGEFKPKVLPNPSVVAEGVTLANTDWGTTTPMIAVGRVSVDVGLWSLLFGPIRIKSLELRDVTVALEQNTTGEANWAFGAGTQPEATAHWSGARLPVVIDLASIENLDIVLRRPEREDARVLATLALRTDEHGVVVANGAGSVGERPFTIDGTITAEGDAATRIGIEASFAETALRTDAVVSAEQIAFEGSVSPLNKLGELFAISGLPAADLVLEGTLLLGADRYELRDGSAKLLGMESRINARMPSSGDAPTELEISINAPNLKELRAELPTVALSATATAHLSPDEIALDPLDLKLGESDYTGSLHAALGDAISVVLKGHSKLLDFTPAQDPTAPADTAAAPAASTPTSQWVFGEEALPFEQLASLSVDAELAVDEVRSRDARIHNVTLDLKGDGGTLRLETSFDVEQGGSAEGNLVLAAQGSSADLSVDFSARDMRLNVASGDVDDPSQIPPVGLSANIRSKGSSPRALAAAATGRVVLTQGAGRIENAAVGLASGDMIAQLFSALNPFAKEEEYSSWECTVVGLTITDGVGVLEPMLAQEKKLLIVGGGTVDLHSEKVDIEFNTKPRTGVGLTADMFVTPFVKITGTLADPGLSLNATGTLLSGGAAVLTGGISLLVQGLTDRATAEGDACEKTLAEAGACEAGMNCITPRLRRDIMKPTFVVSVPLRLPGLPCLDRVDDRPLSWPVRLAARPGPRTRYRSIRRSPRPARTCCSATASPT
jgi:uncharacterized protein involved in outer membrane biogenesis